MALLITWLLASRTKGGLNLIVGGWRWKKKDEAEGLGWVLRVCVLRKEKKPCCVCVFRERKK